MGFDHAWTYDHIAWRSLRDSPWFAAVPTLTAAALGDLHHPAGDAGGLAELPAPGAVRPRAHHARRRSRRPAHRRASGRAARDGTPPSSARSRGRHGAGRRLRGVRRPARPGAARSRRPPTTGTHYSAVAVPERARLRAAAAGAVRHRGHRCAGLRLAAPTPTVWVTNGLRSHEGPPLPGRRGRRGRPGADQRLDEACAAAGRDPASLRASCSPGHGSTPACIAGRWRETRAAYEAAGATDLVVHWPRPTEPYQGDPPRPCRRAPRRRRRGTIVVGGDPADLRATLRHQGARAHSAEGDVERGRVALGGGLDG